MTYDVVAYRSEHRDQVVQLLRRSFGPRKTLDNFIWKHEEGPWGPSLGWVATRSEDVVGVRLLVPWQVRLGERTWPVLRAMDGAVDPSARRQGIFESLIRRAMEASASSAAALYSTSVPASREAYRKVGWSIHDLIPHYVSLAPMWSRHMFVEVMPGELPLEGDTGQITTDWSPEALAWRADPRSGHTYHAARSMQHDDVGVLYRLLRSRPRRLVVLRAVGRARGQVELIGAVARHHRCPVVTYQFASPNRSRVSRIRGCSQVSSWVPPSSTLTLPPPSWRFDGADIEGTL